MLSASVKLAFNVEKKKDLLVEIANLKKKMI
jgi:hypothetical protein